MVLGSGHTCDPVLPATNQLSRAVLGSLVQGIRLHRLLPESKLIASGWKGDNLVTNAFVLKRAAEMLGVSSNDIFTLTKPVNTEEKAFYYKNTFGTNHKLIIVTDAIHMPQAMLRFRKVNLNPTAALPIILQKEVLLKDHLIYSHPPIILVKWNRRCMNI